MLTRSTKENAARALRLTEADNIVVAIDSLPPGQPVFGVAPKERVPRGHKMAIQAIGMGAPVVKYGQVIGFATSDIAPGDWVHERNVHVHSFDRAYAYGTETRPTSFVAEDQRRTFQGFRRANGRYGTRNYIAVLTSVNCSASAARHIARRVEEAGVLAGFPNINGVISLVHGTGFGVDVNGAAYEILRRTQWGYAMNPNVGGVLMVGLGCEAFQIPRWMKSYGVTEDTNFRTLTI